MRDRRQEMLGWKYGWLGGFVWVLILSVVFFVQGKVLPAVAGLVITSGAWAAVTSFSPWRHPHTSYRRLMVPIYLLIVIALVWGVWALGDLRQLGLNGPWGFLILMPAMIPLWTVGKRKWTDGDR